MGGCGEYNFRGDTPVLRTEIEAMTKTLIHVISGEVIVPP